MDGMAAQRAQQQGIAVRIGFGDVVRADLATRAGAVFHHHGLAQLVGQCTRVGMRPAASLAPPGGKGTTSLIGLDAGCPACAWTGRGGRAQAQARTRLRGPPVVMHDESPSVSPRGCGMRRILRRGMTTACSCWAGVVRASRAPARASARPVGCGPPCRPRSRAARPRRRSDRVRRCVQHAQHFAA